MKAPKLSKKVFLQLFVILVIIVLAFIPKDKLTKKAPAINPVEVTIDNDKIVKPSPEIANKGEKLVIDKTNFVDKLTEIHSSIEEYQGVELELEGFVERRKGLQTHQFYISRTIISCCSEDAQTMGIFSYWEGDAPTDNTWVKARGTLQEMEYKNPATGVVGTVPVLIIDELEEVEKPEDPFIEL